MKEASPVQPKTIGKPTIDLTKREAICCPVCFSNNKRAKYSIQTWKIVECTNCRFVYVNPRLEKKELLKLYESDYFDNQLVGYFHYTEGKELRKKNFRKWVTDASTFLPRQNRIKALDVGCAAGYCLEVFQEQEWQPHGIELDHALAHALRQKGFMVFDSPLLQSKHIGKYGLITMFDVIEHLTDLHENVSILHQLLEDDGIVVLVTPNFDSWQRRLFRKKWFQLKPVEHINYFTRETLGKLVEANGFEIVTTRHSGQFCNTAFLENRLKKYRLQPLLPFLRFAQKVLGNKERFFYVDTASLYVVMKKASAA